MKEEKELLPVTCELSVAELTFIWKQRLITIITTHAPIFINIIIFHTAFFTVSLPHFLFP